MRQGKGTNGNSREKLIGIQQAFHSVSSNNTWTLISVQQLRHTLLWCGTRGLHLLMPLFDLVLNFHIHGSMRLTVTTHHWFMWNCTSFCTVLFLTVFNNLLALLYTATKAQLSGRALYHVYCRFNCSIKFLNASLPYLNKQNCKTHDKSFHVCVFLWLHSHFSKCI